MRIRYLFLWLALMAAAGCAPIPPAKPVKIYVPFDPDQTSRMLRQGTNTIKGSALLRQQGGGVVTCAGQEVQLIPATAYSNERFLVIYGSYEGGFNPVNRSFSFEDESPLYQTLRHKTRCDAQGYFKFEKVADGQFFVVTSITWTLGSSPQGGAVGQKVQLQGGEVKEIVLSRT